MIPRNDPDIDPEQTSPRRGFPRCPQERRLSDPPAREKMFLQPAIRLATFPSFNPQLVVAQINGVDQAANAYRICNELVDRLHAVQDCLRTSFPEVAEG